MKQIFIVWLSTLLTSTVCSAQNKTTWGLQARIGASTYRPVELGNASKFLPTSGANIYADVPISRYLSFRPQLGWLRKGFQQSSNGVSGSAGQPITVIESKFSYDYLPLDLTIVLRTRPGKALKPFIQLGGRGSLLINNRIKRTSANQMVSGTLDLDNYRRLTIGGLLVVGVEWKRFAVGLETNHDLSTYLNVPSIPGFEDLKPKFQWYGINMSYQLRNF